MVVFDTSFIVDLFNGRENAKKIALKYGLVGEELKVPSVVVMEIISGAVIHAKKEGERDDAINFLSGLTILNFDFDSAVTAGDIEAELTKKGEIIDEVDIMIGAIVKKNDEVLITKNAKHFERINGLKIEGY
jgi:predicted nucleic acid-binding protein